MTPSDERDLNARRSAQSQHRTRAPRSASAQEAARNDARIRRQGSSFSGETVRRSASQDGVRRTSAGRRTSAASYGEKASSGRARTAAEGSGRYQTGSGCGTGAARSDRTGSLGGGRNKKGGSPAAWIIGLIAAVVVILVVVFILRGMKSGKEEASSEPETTYAEGAFRLSAKLDLSVLPEAASLLNENGETAGQASSKENETKAPSGSAEGTGEQGGVQAAVSGMLSIQGLTPEEVKEKVSSLYSWSMSVYNDQAEVGATVKPTVDASETTEAATLGDAENPDSLPSEAQEETDPALTEITVTNEIQVPDLVMANLDALLTEIRADDDAWNAERAAAESASAASGDAESGTAASQEAEKIYRLSLDNAEEAAAAVASEAETMWYKMPKGGSIGSYDKSSDKFIMEGAESGFAVDEAALTSKIAAAISSGDFSARIEVPGETLSAEAETSEADYKIIGSYTTKTTSNSIRNKNIQLACDAINGTILKPGEEFSFNNVVGQRTEQKGYGAAAAYNEGEVVQEVGGGICQVSTTLYNAVLRAGLKTTKRQSHTFEPSYVTPGMDATVSWGGPDYRFANVPQKEEYSNPNSYSIGIKAHYADRTVTISIYGRPVLKSGYTYELSSKKEKDIDVVRKLIEPGSDKQPTTGTKGSQWATNLVIKKDGSVVSNKLDHNTYYSGHIEYYTDQPQTTAPSTEVPTLPTETVPIAETPAEPASSEPQYMTGVNGGPGVTLGGNEGPGAGNDAPGPGVPETTAAPTPAPVPETTAAAPAPTASPQPGPGDGGAVGGPISDAPPAL